MEFIDLAAQQARIKTGIEKRIATVLEHGRYIMGPEISELENKLTKFVGCNYTVSCANGTDALLMALMAYGVRPGDVVITTPFTFVATAEVLPMLGATPIFVDVDPETFNINPTSIKEAIHKVSVEYGKRLKGIIAVDLFGLLADYSAIYNIAQENNLFVLQDAAQSFGAECNGVRSCNNAAIATTSFFPAKPLGCYGDGGAVFCRDEDVYNYLCSIRIHGQGVDKYENIRIGMNGRMDTLQAAILLEKLNIFPEEIELRNQVATRYHQALQNNYRLQSVPAGYTSVWAQYGIVTENRAEVLSRLKEAAIPTAIYYPIPLHKQKAFQDNCICPVSLAAAEELSQKIFSVPMHPYLSTADQTCIIEVLMQ